MTLVKFNPMRDLVDIEREFNRMFNSFENKFGISRSKEDNEYENAVWMPLTDIYEDKDKYSLKLDLPGIKKEDVKISFVDGKLNISGERNVENEHKDSKCHELKDLLEDITDHSICQSIFSKKKLMLNLKMDS